MPLKLSRSTKRRKQFLTGLSALLLTTLIAIGIFAKNGWLPTTDTLTGKRTGWFGSHLAENTSSSWNPFAPPLPTPTLQLSKEYIYAGSQLLAVEDAGANAIAPADLAVWRPSSATWWVLGGAGGSQPATQSWGIPTDKPVPGDYDGDGKTDFSVYRPATGEWYILQSTDGAWSVSAWGSPSDIRVPADYDGDGKTDRAVWRPSTGVWYIVKSSDTTSVYQPFGTSNDLPSPADYDGDGRADLALWRGAERKFYSLASSTDRTTIIPFVQSAAETVSADYDGDGRADYAIRNASDWVIRQSSNGQTSVVTWQSATDIAVQNDYDADGKVDVAVWRPTNTPAGTLGTWFIRQSASGNALRQVQWGMAGDWPVPALYRR